LAFFQKSLILLAWRAEKNDGDLSALTTKSCHTASESMLSLHHFLIVVYVISFRPWETVRRELAERLICFLRSVWVPQEQTQVARHLSFKTNFLRLFSLPELISELQKDCFERKADFLVKRNCA